MSCDEIERGHAATSHTVSETLAGVVGRIVMAVEPDAIILFGSRARGDHEPDSDHDLCVLVPTGNARLSDLRAAAWTSLGSFRGHVDLVIFETAQFNQHRWTPGSLEASIDADGIILYQRRTMNLIGADNFIRHARRDVAAAELLLDAEVVDHENAANLTEQACEKAIKAVLELLGIKYSIRSGAGHDVRALAASVPGASPYAAHANAIVAATSWGANMRYMPMGTPMTAPDAPTIRAHLAHATALVDMVVRNLPPPSTNLVKSLLSDTPPRGASRQLVALWVDEALLLRTIAPPSPADTDEVHALRLAKVAIQQPGLRIADTGGVVETGSVKYGDDGIDDLLQAFKACGKKAPRARLYFSQIRLDQAVAAAPTFAKEFASLAAASSARAPKQSTPQTKGFGIV